MFPFEQTEVYKKAYQVNRKLYRFIKRNKTTASYARSQLGRAGVSIMLNIAEGSAKYSNRDRKNYFITARGSVFECFALISFLREEEEISEDFKTELCQLLDKISRMPFVMIKNLNEQ